MQYIDTDKDIHIIFKELTKLADITITAIHIYNKGEGT